MGKLFFIGDIHGDFILYRKLIEKIEKTDPGAESIQLGDMEIRPGALDGISTRHRFLKGNHDDPEVCSADPHYIGAYGFDERLGVFYVGGAASTGVSETFCEELTDAELDAAVRLYTRCREKIRVVVSHDAPKRPYGADWTKTRRAIAEMTRPPYPPLWVHGHGHNIGMHYEKDQYGAFLSVQVGLQTAVPLDPV